MGKKEGNAGDIAVLKLGSIINVAQRFHSFGQSVSCDLIDLVQICFEILEHSNHLEMEGIKAVSPSSTEAEYLALSEVSKFGNVSQVNHRGNTRRHGKELKTKKKDAGFPMNSHSVDLVKGEIKSRKNLCLLSVLNSYHSRTCLPENVCKFLFHRYVYSYLALVSIVAGVRNAL
ncbi:hypothetical protein T4D_144 [Trichinella pseudospiralis]|uniref:Uncharacterized protein n=1 Tax=Trichinella pseudospiralis TaxID=6337 RepID=A0A0V1FJP4_TRIPS|nr:hypothetical protein T4D_144 [Trichinella pseudospiralis]